LQIDLYFIALQREGGKIAWVGVAWVGVSEALMTDQTVDFVRRSLDLGVLYAASCQKRGFTTGQGIRNRHLLAVDVRHRSG
jgi:hypothetical protein